MLPHASDAEYLFFSLLASVAMLLLWLLLLLFLVLLLLLALNIRAFSQQAGNNKSHCRALHVLNDKHNYVYTLASERE